jgi:hypothetical protein
MKEFSLLIPFVASAVLLSGCFMHTVVGNGNGVESPDKRLTLRVECHGASRKAYVDLTKKRVFVVIWRKDSDYLHDDGKRLFLGKYVFAGADLCSDVRWHSSQDVTVDFFDFGDRVSCYDAEKTGARSNHIATLDFTWDPKTEQFVGKK